MVAVAKYSTSKLQLITLERQSIERRGKNDLAWYGRVKGSMDSEAVLTLKHGLVYGRLRIVNELFEFHTSKGRQLTVEKVDLSQYPEWDDDAIPVVTGDDSLDSLQGPYVMASSSDGTTTIDLLSVYSNDALNDAGSIVFAALGDFGNGSSASAGVASLVNSWSPDFIVTAGDNRYGSSSFDQVIG